MTFHVVKRLQLLLLLLALSVTIPTPSEAATATGYVPFKCPMTGYSRLHLTTLDGHNLTREFVLVIPERLFWGYVDPKEWFDYQGEDCSSGDCEAATHSRVQISRVSYGSHALLRPRRPEIAGNFEIELRDGRKFSGSFRAKLRKPPKNAICE